MISERVDLLHQCLEVLLHDLVGSGDLIYHAHKLIPLSGNILVFADQLCISSVEFIKADVNPPSITGLLSL